jgi:hypothetical protein
LQRSGKRDKREGEQTKFQDVQNFLTSKITTPFLFFENSFAKISEYEQSYDRLALGYEDLEEVNS